MGESTSIVVQARSNRDNISRVHELVNPIVSRTFVDNHEVCAWKDDVNRDPPGEQWLARLRLGTVMGAQLF